MQSIINFKFWKKFSERFGKKKLKSGIPSCLNNNQTEAMDSVLKTNILCQHNSCEKMSVYSIDSLEEKNVSTGRSKNNSSYNELNSLLGFQQLKKKSISMHSTSLQSLKNDASFSEDSLRSESSSLDSLYKQINESQKIGNESVNSLKTSAEHFSNKKEHSMLLSQPPTRDRSQSVGDSYKIKNTITNNLRNSFLCRNRYCEGCIIASISSAKVVECGDLSFDSLDGIIDRTCCSTTSLVQGSISNDSLDDESIKYRHNFKTIYKIKSSSVGLLHKTKHFQSALHNKNIFSLKQIKSNKIQNNYENVSNIKIKCNPRHRHSSENSLEEFLRLPIYGYKYVTMSIDSLCDSQSEFVIISKDSITNTQSDPKILQNQKSKTKHLLNIKQNSDKNKIKQPTIRPLSQTIKNSGILNGNNNPIDNLNMKSYSYDSLNYDSPDFSETLKQESISADSLNDFSN